MRAVSRRLVGSGGTGKLPSVEGLSGGPVVLWRLTGDILDSGLYLGLRRWVCLSFFDP